MKTDHIRPRRVRELDVRLQPDLLAARLDPQRGFRFAHANLRPPNAGNARQLLYPIDQPRVVDVCEYALFEV